ncbi:MAG TPA: hypothetical protein PKD38_18980 [Nitrospira sp.]|nr:hypothetical protein [Nitrospira sp.]HNA87355.1 hypothetical protein [Nitrospira sp.]
MIQPFDGHVRFVLARLGSLGFRVAEEGTHHFVFEKAEFRLTMSCERYRPDNVALTLVHPSDDMDVGAMHVADIMEILAPADLDRLRSIDLNTSEGIRKALLEQVEFLARNEKAIFVRPAAYRSTYELNNRPDWAT